MQNLLQKGMYTFEIKWALRAKFGKDIGGLIFSNMISDFQNLRFLKLTENSAQKINILVSFQM